MKNYKNLWLIYFILTVLSAIISYHFLMTERWINALLFASVSVIFLILVHVSLSNRIVKAEKIIDAIIQKDFSLFPKEEGSELITKTIKLYYQSKEETTAISSYKLLYEGILDQLDTGIMILSKHETEWQIFYANPAFIDILEIPRYNLWQLYESKIPEFYKIIEETNYENSQAFFDISIKQNNKQSFSLRTKQIKNLQHQFYIITLESVQKIIEQKEKLAWNNLMKVISHELLNTLTPINSLLQNLEYISKQDVVDKDDQEEMKESLAIMNSKSRQLLNFVDDYRQVAELPKPILKNISLKSIVESAVNFLRQEFENNNIKIIVDLEEHHVLADQKMIERSLINLCINAIFAVSEQQDKMIKIFIKSKNNRIILSVEDNGSGITPEIKDKIFLPFFTTRNSGSGIGLTLSKSIMEAHRGYLNYHPLAEGSAFEMWFLQ